MTAHKPAPPDQSTEKGTKGSPGPERLAGLLPDPTTWRDWTKQFVVGTSTGLRNRSRFAEVERFVLFVGYPRSGHSLIGSLLNAHPDMLIAHEVGVFDYLNRHFGRTALYGLILERDLAFAELGRQWSDYDYTVPGQFQGSFRRLSVIGDKRGGNTAMWILRKPQLLDQLRKTVGVPIRVLHVIRNPYDNIVTMAKRAETSIDDKIERYSRLCEGTAKVRELLAPEEILDVSYENFLSNPRAGLEEMCGFLGVEADQKYLDDCTSIVWSSGTFPRKKVDWSDEQVTRVKAIIDRYEGLHDYSFGI
jgi:hypothetical protein